MADIDAFMQNKSKLPPKFHRCVTVCYDAMCAAHLETEVMAKSTGTHDADKFARVALAFIRDYLDTVIPPKWISIVMEGSSPPPD